MPDLLASDFYRMGWQTITRSFWAGAFYTLCRERAMRHQAALRALASGSEFSIDARSTAHPMTRLASCSPCRNARRHSSRLLQSHQPRACTFTRWSASGCESCARDRLERAFIASTAHGCGSKPLRSDGVWLTALKEHVVSLAIRRDACAIPTNMVL